MLMKKLLFVINPNSGKKGTKNGLIDALNIFSAADYQVEVYCTQKPLDCYEMLLKRGSEFDIVVVSGGDGTLNETTNALMKLETKPMIGYIPTGTMNDFAKNFDLTTSFKKTAKKIVSQRSSTFDVGKINDKYFNYVAGFGAFTNVSYETERELKENLGDAAYILSALGEIPNIHPIHVKMTIDGAPYENDVIMGLIANGRTVSGIDMIAPNENLMRDGLFDLVLVEWTPNLIEWIHYPLGIFNPTNNEKFVTRIQASHITIETEETIEWTLDGEKGDQTNYAVIDNIHTPLEILY